MTDKLDIIYMKEALKEASCAEESGNIPVGAVIVKENKIIARGRNARYSEKDPIAHAEVRAIQEASRVIGDWRCLDTTLYVTLEPCLMCIGAIINARISRLVFGTWDERFGALSLYNIDQNNLTNHKFEVTSEVLQEECAKILKDFFQKIRRV